MTSGHKELNEEVLAEVFKRVLEEQGVAIAKDVARIDERPTGHDEKFREVDKIMADMERRMEQAAASVSGPKRTSTGSRSMSSNRGSSIAAASPLRLRRLGQAAETGVRRGTRQHLDSA